MMKNTCRGRRMSVQLPVFFLTRERKLADEADCRRIAD
jgi:hypothetical protein